MGWRGDESAGIYQLPVPGFSSQFGHEICASQPSLIIEDTNFTEPTYHTWMSCLSLSLFSASFVFQFRRIDEPLLVTAFMTRRPLALLGPRPPSPHLLYNRLSVRFTILLPPRPHSQPAPLIPPSPPPSLTISMLYGLLSLSKTCQILLVPVVSIWPKDTHPSTETPKDAQGWYQ
jgi:hypothetical protein